MAMVTTPGMLEPMMYPSISRTVCRILGVRLISGELRNTTTPSNVMSAATTPMKSPLASYADFAAVTPKPPLKKRYGAVHPRKLGPPSFAMIYHGRTRGSKSAAVVTSAPRESPPV